MREGLGADAALSEAHGLPADLVTDVERAGFRNSTAPVPFRASLA
jgi:hypothetical protein